MPAVQCHSSRDAVREGAVSTPLQVGDTAKWAVLYHRLVREQVPAGGGTATWLGPFDKSAYLAV